ncbi:MAG: LuxR C-terminal-related transcriptional regulator [Proteobacteria bacterium]|nr:LuxR C-terminal-related transcriptional regulator [Pseudomonadota bacterium]
MPSHSSSVETSTLYHSQRLKQALCSIHSKQVTFIHAPMGYGKTVAVREYLGEHKAQSVWVSVLTQDPGTFWRDFCRVLHKSLPGEAVTLEILEELGYPCDPAKVDAARGLIGRLDFPTDAVLVFDDVHLLPETEGWGLVRLCLLLVRQGVFPPIVFISRHSPGREMAEALLKGVATEIGPAPFALGQEDIRAYFELCGISLAEAEAATLLKATGGWISALYLYLLHYSRHGQLAAPTELSVLLASQVFDKLGDEARLLLLVLSPLVSFSVPQAKLFCEDAHAVLADVLRRNAFISFDPVTEGYMLHALFRGFLLEHFSILPLEQQQDAYLRNARWLIRHDEIRKAVKLLGEVKDSTEALELLNTVAERLQVTDGNGLLLALFRTFQPSLMDRYPGVMFRFAMAALSARDIPTFSDLLARLERYCASLPEDDATANGWRGEMELLLALTKFNDITAMSAHHRRAAEFFRRAGAGGSRLFGQDPWTLGSPSVLYMFHRESGALEKALVQMRECLPHYSRLTGMHGAGAESAILGEARYNAGEFEAAAVAAHQALASAQEHGQIGIEVCARFLLARLSMQQGEYDRCLEQLALMRARVEQEKAFSLLQTTDLCMGLLHVSLRRPERIPQWLVQGADEKFYAFAGGFASLVMGGALLLAGEFAELVGRFSQLLQQGVFSKNLMFSIHAQLFIAAGNTGLGFWAKADSALFEALDMALPDRIYMPFAMRTAFLPQLKNLRDDPTYGPGVRRILKLAARFEKNRNAVVSRFFQGDTPSLTPREGELVRLAVTGMTYKDIATALGLAPNSVKRYFAALYKKLGISSREQLMRHFEEKGGSL